MLEWLHGKKEFLPNISFHLLRALNLYANKSMVAYNSYFSEWHRQVGDDGDDKRKEKSGGFFSALRRGHHWKPPKEKRKIKNVP